MATPLRRLARGRARALRPADEALRLQAAQAAIDLFRWQEARDWLEAGSVAASPAAELLLARIDLQQGDPEACLRRLLRRSTELQPGSAATRLHLDALFAAGRTGEAIALLRRCVQMRPDDQESALRLANAWMQRGEPEHALADFERVGERYPDDAALHSAILVASSLCPDTTPEHLLQRSRRHPLARSDTSMRRPAPARPEGLGRRWGFVSPRFIDGPVASLLLPVLGELRSRGIDVVLYPSSVASDVRTADFQASAGRWQCLDPVDDALAAQVIAADKVDVLFDLCGHSPGGRPGIFLKRPAPLQFAWLDYFATTGMDCFDGIILDPWLCPDGDERFYSEPVLRLPSGRLCFAPLPDLDQGAFDPQRKRFACFNRMNKLNDTLLDDWSGLLRQLPDWDLQFKGSGYAVADDRDQLLRRFALRGVGAERIRFDGWSSHDDALAAYRDVAVALDTHPFSGCLTTVDAIWMGVPTASLAGRTFASRQSASLLSAIGCPHWVAHSRSQWLQMTLALAADVEQRRLFHQQARERARAALFDCVRFCDELIAALSTCQR